MADVALEQPRARFSERDTFSARAVRFSLKAPIHLILVGLGLLWLVPTAGLFFTSILPAQTFTVEGW